MLTVGAWRPPATGVWSTAVQGHMVLRVTDELSERYEKEAMKVQGSGRKRRCGAQERNGHDVSGSTGMCGRRTL